MPLLTSIAKIADGSELEAHVAALEGETSGERKPGAC
jgi:hypothetical protein